MRWSTPRVNAAAPRAHLSMPPYANSRRRQRRRLSRRRQRGGKLRLAVRRGAVEQRGAGGLERAADGGAAEPGREQVVPGDREPLVASPPEPVARRLGPVGGSQRRRLQRAAA